jgi:hypothetical protein
MDFKVGDLVECRDTIHGRITCGEKYQVVEVTPDYVFVLDDDGIRSGWIHSRFALAERPRVTDTAAKTAEANARGEGYKADEEKPDWSLLSLDVLEDTVRVLTLGAKKYARDNWQKVPNGRERYFAAALRHLTAWQRGEANDPETGLPHLAHAQCCLTFLGWIDKHGDKP